MLFDIDVWRSNLDNIFCPNCNGKGTLEYPDDGRVFPKTFDCDVCAGSGVVQRCGHYSVATSNCLRPAVTLVSEDEVRCAKHQRRRRERWTIS